MKSENPKTDDSQLSRLLSNWRVDHPLPPRFQEHVWKRIETGESLIPKPYETAWFMTLFAHPAFATACATLLLVAGLTTGFMRASHDAARMNTQLAQRYVASVDPYAHQNR